MKGKNILFLYSTNLKEGQPSLQRINSFKFFYKKNDFIVFEKYFPTSFKERLELIYFCYSNQVFNIFISMPPFKNWFLFFIPFVKLVFDIRDGWSIAMKSGYGNTVSPNLVKSYLASLLEFFFINRAALAITCTTGLQSYFKNLTSKNILLITNGYNKIDYEIVQKLKSEKFEKQQRIYNMAVCVGQFSEYGNDKVKILLCKINKLNKKTIIKLIGSNITKNLWLINWIKINDLSNIELIILPRMNRINMYQEILASDFGIAIIRDPNFDFGTKVFDYILCNKPIFDYFDNRNNFTAFFNDQLFSNNKLNFEVNFFRNQLIEREKEILIGCLK